MGLLRIEVVEMAVDPEVQGCALASVFVLVVYVMDKMMGGEVIYICRSGDGNAEDKPRKGGPKDPYRSKNLDQTEVSPPKDSAQGLIALVSNT